MNYQLDLTAYRCPLPLLMAKKALDSLDNSPNGTILRLRLNPESAVKDFELLCQEMGYRLISCQKDTALYNIVEIQKS